MSRRTSRWPTRWKPLAMSRADYIDVDRIRKRTGPILRRGPRAAVMPLIGEDPLEKRAVSRDAVPDGSLAERIMYKELLRRSLSFDFQGSMMGGRNILGGAVADFVLWDAKLVIRVHGRIWHSGIWAEWRDDMQRLHMESLGYEVLDMFDDEVYNEDFFDDWLSRHLDRLHVVRRFH